MSDWVLIAIYFAGIATGAYAIGTLTYWRGRRLGYQAALRDLGYAPAGVPGPGRGGGEGS